MRQDCPVTGQPWRFVFFGHSYYWIDMVKEHSTDCRSNEGITVGLVDAIISIARVLARRDLDHPDVIEALKDLAYDEDVKAILQAAQHYE